MYRTVCAHDHPYLQRASLLNGIILDISRVVPEHPLKEGDYDSETENAIRIPCNPTFDIPQPHMIPPADLDRCDTSFARSGDVTQNLMTHLSALHPGSSTCLCKQRKGPCILCILNHDHGPSSTKTGIWTTHTSNITHGNWHLPSLVPVGGRRLP